MSIRIDVGSIVQITPALEYRGHHYNRGLVAAIGEESVRCFMWDGAGKAMLTGEGFPNYQDLPLEKVRGILPPVTKPC